MSNTRHPTPSRRRRIILTCVWLVTLALALPYSLWAQAPQLQSAPKRQRITIPSTLEDVTSAGAGHTQFYLLWNKRLRARPIGHSFYRCQHGYLRIEICSAIYALPYGKIAAIGEVHTFNRYTMIITGGTTSKEARKAGQPGYLGAVGTIDVRRLEPGTYALLFLLEL